MIWFNRVRISKIAWRVYIFKIVHVIIYIRYVTCMHKKESDWKNDTESILHEIGGVLSDHIGKVLHIKVYKAWCA